MNRITHFYFEVTGCCGPDCRLDVYENQLENTIYIGELFE